MTKWTCSGTVEVSFDDVTFYAHDHEVEKLGLEYFISRELEHRGVLLDIKGGRTGAQGYITFGDVTDISYWDTDQYDGN